MWPDPIVTEISPLKDFFPAEEYHKDYFNICRNEPCCSFTVAPKVKKFKRIFAEKLKVD